MAPRPRLGLNGFDVLEVDTGYVTPCHIPLSSWGRPFGLDQDGYSVTMRKNEEGRRVRIRLHRVRYEAVHGPLEGELVPDHLCRHRPCCNPAHMEAVTIAENNRRGLGAKLTPEKVLEIRAMRAAGMRCVDIAEKFGVSASVVSRAARGENWAAGPAPAWQAVKRRRLQAQ